MLRKVAVVAALALALLLIGPLGVLVVCLGLLIANLVMLLRAIAVASGRGHRQWANLLLWVLCYATSILTPARETRLMKAFHGD